MTPSSVELARREAQLVYTRTVPERRRRSGAPAVAREGWRDRAKCAGADPEIFDAPSNGARTSAADRARARNVIRIYCARCVVAPDCLADALAHNSTGIRGGRYFTHEHGSITAYVNHKKRGEDACGPCLEAAAAYQRDRRDSNAPRNRLRSVG